MLTLVERDQYALPRLPANDARLASRRNDWGLMVLSAIAKRYSPFSFPGRLIRLPLKLVPSGAVLPVLTGVNRGMRWIVGSSSMSAAWLGTFEDDHMSAVQRALHPGMVVFDVGANVGYYTLAFSRLVGESGRVFSFEPDGRNCHMLRRHIEINHLRNITSVQVAISNKSELVGFGGSMERGTISAKSTYQIPAMSLDEFIRAGNPEPSFVKMDIEGAEQSALCGATSLLSRGNAVWMMATHSEELKCGCKKIMARYGYRFTAFDCASEPGDCGDFIAFPPPH